MKIKNHFLLTKIFVLIPFCNYFSENTNVFILFPSPFQPLTHQWNTA